ncbi:hypothetical protein D5045_12145 [Verminephrobacter eiseniae]|uniref:AAA family ATPase n=1 Tax=Verminephrobacter eiseniae TaxID=364317 RepID=UPI0022376486|nr:AAA family ATPase [Verminephrobacter eiseniae]MCW5260910.1 hypothetical protein [Verminephrobacter eiseniae]
MLVGAGHERQDGASMAHCLIFLIGLHGVGKSTIGQALVPHGYRHISLGDLGRLLRRRRIPDGFTLRFLRLLAAHEPGERMSAKLVDALHGEIGQHNAHVPLVVDGFPAEPYQVMGLPAGCTLIHLTCPAPERMQRLAARSETTRRKWGADAAESRRDRQLGAVIEAAQERTDMRTLEIPNLGLPQQVAATIAALATQVQRQSVVFSETVFASR